jgi:hypothetical protein
MLGRMTARPPVLSARPGLRLPALVALTIVASLVLASCGGKDDDKKAEDRPSSQPTQGGTELAAVWPLTGLPAPAETPDHPVMVVKIDNSEASEPQIGLGKADMVVEELVEGGITRLAAMFYSKLPTKAGPVRSARASDIGVVTPTHAVLVASGMAPPTVARLNAAKVRYFTMGAPGVVRDPDGLHDLLHSVFVDLPKLAKSLKKHPVVPASYLPWGQESDFAGGQPAAGMSVQFSGGSTTTFKYNAQTKKYLNTNSHANADDQFKPDSVLVLRVREGDAGYRDPAGNPVPETLFFGKGQLMLFHNGQVTRGTWSKAKRESSLVLTTAAGAMKVPAGHVWIELLPNKKNGGAVRINAR